MKTVRHLLTGVALVLALAVLGTDYASAQTTGNLYGTVKTLGVESHGWLTAIVSSTFCDGDQTVTDRSISFVKFSPLDDNDGVAMKNIHSTLLAALLSGKPVYIQTQNGCTNSNTIDITGGVQVVLNP
jgi:hypothetical protein